GFVVVVDEGVAEAEGGTTTKGRSPGYTNPYCSRAIRSTSASFWRRRDSSSSLLLCRCKSSRVLRWSSVCSRCASRVRAGNTKTNSSATRTIAAISTRTRTRRRCRSAAVAGFRVAGARRVRLSAPRPSSPSATPASPAESLATEVAGDAVEVVFDAQQLVVLGDPIAAGRGAALQLPAVRRHGEIGDGRVLGLAAAMRHDRGVTMPRSQEHGVQRLAQGADLVHLDEDPVGPAGVDPALQSRRVGDEQVVADQLDAIANASGELRPAVPVVLGHAVLDRHDRVAVDERGEPIGPIDRRVGGALPRQLVATVG